MVPCRGGGPCGCSSDAEARSHSAHRCNSHARTQSRPRHHAHLARSTCGVSCQSRRKHEDRMNDQRGTRRLPHRPRRVSAAITTIPGLAMPNIRTSTSRRICSILSQLGLGRSERPTESWTRRLISARLPGGRPPPVIPLPRRDDNAKGARRELAGGTSAMPKRQTSKQH